MKAGDLVKHTEDEVLGLIIEGPIAYDVSHHHSKPDETYNPRFKVHWFDWQGTCDEAVEDIELISATPEKK